MFKSTLLFPFSSYYVLRILIHSCLVCTYLQSFILIDRVALEVIKCKVHAFVSVRFMIPTLVGFCSRRVQSPMAISHNTISISTLAVSTRCQFVPINDRYVSPQLAQTAYVSRYSDSPAEIERQMPC